MGGEHLTIQLSWLAPWLLHKHVCPVHLVQRWQLQSWTVVVATNQLWNLKLDCSWQYGGYVYELPPLKHRFNNAETPILFCLTATEMACANDVVDQEVMYKWRQLTLAEWVGLRMCEWWGWSMLADCWYWVRFSPNACVWICWRWGVTSVGVEWGNTGIFCWELMRGQERQSMKGYFSGVGRGAGPQTECLILWLVWNLPNDGKW